MWFRLPVAESDEVMVIGAEPFGDPIPEIQAPKKFDDDPPG